MIFVKDDNDNNTSHYAYRMMLPVVMSTGCFLFIFFMAKMALPTFHPLHVIVVLCGSKEGYLFSILFLSFLFLLVRLVYSGLCSTISRCRRNVIRHYYQALPLMTNISEQQQQQQQQQQQSSLSSSCNKEEEEEEDISPIEKERQEPCHKHFHKKHVIVDALFALLLYVVLCTLAYTSWAPTIFFDVNHHDDTNKTSIPDNNNKSLIQFPKDFKFGAATSSYQVEGNLYNNQWAEFEQINGTIQDNQHCGEAADVWNRFESDVEEFIVGDLELDSFRFSVEWSRIEPEQGVFNETALERYASWAQLLKQQHGVEPMVTLHHFTNPIWFEQMGGFTNPNAPELILPFVQRVVHALKPFVTRWITINEPLVYAGEGFMNGNFPPGQKGQLWTMLRVVNILFQTHERMYETIQEEMDPFESQISIAKNTVLYQPWSFFDLGAIVTAAIADLYYNTMPIRVLQQQSSLDYLGLNSYFRLKVNWLWKMQFVLSPEQQSDMGWDLDPNVLYNVVKQYHAYAPELPIIITEHGVAAAADENDNNDHRRLVFVRDSLIGLSRAIHQEGIPVVEYIHWSLLDNWEWANGFIPKFGLYRVDIPHHNQTRVLTEGGRFYRQLIHQHHTKQKNDAQ